MNGVDELSKVPPVAGANAVAQLGATAETRKLNKIIKNTLKCIFKATLYLFPINYLVIKTNLTLLILTGLNTHQH